MEPSVNARLETERLILEPQAVAHAPEVFKALQDPSLYTYIASPPPQDLEALSARFQQLESRRSPDGKVHWLNWVLVERQSGGLVGKIDASLEATGQAEFGCILFSPGRGFATEALVVVLPHLARMGATHFRATVTVGNHASRRVLEKLGFHLNAVLPGNDMIRGQVVDDWEFLRDAQP